MDYPGHMRAGDLSKNPDPNKLTCLRAGASEIQPARITESDCRILVVRRDRNLPVIPCGTGANDHAFGPVDGEESGVRLLAVLSEVDSALLRSQSESHPHTHTSKIQKNNLPLSKNHALSIKPPFLRKPSTYLKQFETQIVQGSCLRRKFREKSAMGRVSLLPAPS